jgi:hypothetical protein
LKLQYEKRNCFRFCCSFAYNFHLRRCTTVVVVGIDAEADPARAAIASAASALVTAASEAAAVAVRAGAYTRPIFG